MTQVTRPAGSQASPPPSTPVNVSPDGPPPLERYPTPPPPPPIDPSSLPEPQRRIYTCLRTQGWSPQQCDFYFAKIPSIQHHVYYILGLMGWNKEQLGRFEHYCVDYLPEGLPPPDPDPEDSSIPVPNFWINHRLLEDVNLRRKHFATQMYREMSEAEKAEIEMQRTEQRGSDRPHLPAPIYPPQ
ncbi:hypothetical protein BJX99DRAFT_263118 [Aspergillus californicus]